MGSQIVGHDGDTELNWTDALRNGVSPAMSVEKDVTNISRVALQCDLVKPEGTQEGV